MSISLKIRKKLSKNFTLQAEFESGDGCLGILGASGSGKSMTLKCIAGIEKPDEGFILVNGRVLFDSASKINLKPQERHVGYLFQNYALFPTMTVFENITVALKKSAREKQLAAAAWIKRLRLDGLERSYPARLSGGEQQRTALARMLIHEPEAVLLDEPFSALDTNLREYMQIQLQELLEERGNDGNKLFQNTILVTHSRDEVFRLSNDLALMDGGKIIAAGNTRELFKKPPCVTAARLTGCKNISTGQIVSENEIFAAEWGLRLRVQGNLDGVTHIGIRAHDLVPVREGEKYGFNEMTLQVMQESSEPFENWVIFVNAEAKAPTEKTEIWWKYSKYAHHTVPAKLFFPPESLLLLRG